MRSASPCERNLFALAACLRSQRLLLPQPAHWLLIRLTERYVKPRHLPGYFQKNAVEGRLFHANGPAPLGSRRPL
jgi:hypothetical protein